MPTVPNRLCGLAHCTLPLISAPMLGSGDVALARAVASTGAIGSVPCSGMPAAQLRALVRDNGGHRLCYNFFCHRPPSPATAALSAEWVATLGPYYATEGIADPVAAVQRRFTAVQPTHFVAEQLTALLDGCAEWAEEAKQEAHPLLVSFHFGLPPDEVWDRLRAAAGAQSTPVRTACSATTVEEAVYLHQRGVDILVCQGAEAGGHRGLFLPSSRVEEQLGTFALVPQVRAALGPSACLVAAGGIVDACTARAALALGADGVQIGTSYLRTAEAKTSPLHRRALKSAQETGFPGTSMTNLFTGRPARGLRNRLMTDLGSLRADAPVYPCGSAYLLDLRQRAEAAGRDDYSQLWAGQNLRGCSEGSAVEKTLEIAAAFQL